MSKLIAILLTLSVLFGLAGTWAVRAEVASAAAKDEEPQSYETRVYVRKQCLISEAGILPPEAPPVGAEILPALAAIFVPLLIEKAIGAAGAALKKAGAEETLRDSGRLPTYMYQLSVMAGTKKLSVNPNFRCVLVVRGSFSGVDDPDQTTVDFSAGGGVLTGENQESQRITRLTNSHIPIKEIASLYEAAIQPSDDKTALYYQTRFLEVNSFQGSRSSKTRALVVSLALNGAGAKEGEPTLSLALVNMGEVKKDTVVTSGRRTGWLGGVGVSDEALKAIENAEPAPGKPKGVMPVTLEATFVETEDGIKALRFIGEVLDATKGEVSKAISSEILDKDKKAAAAADVREKLHQDEETAYADYLKAVEAQVEAGVPFPVPAGTEPTAAQQVKIFEVERMKRIWCEKYAALKSVGENASGPRPSCSN